FKEDPSAVGRILQAGPGNLKIVGVLPQEFRLWSPGQTELYLPLRLSAGQNISPGARGIRALGRLQQGVSLEQAQAEIEAITNQFRSENSLAKDSELLSVKALQEIPREGFPEIWQTVYWLLGVVSFVLLIAYINFASLVLQRRRGMGIAVKRPVTPSCEV